MGSKISNFSMAGMFTIVFCCVTSDREVLCGQPQCSFSVAPFRPMELCGYSDQWHPLWIYPLCKLYLAGARSGKIRVDVVRLCWRGAITAFSCGDRAKLIFHKCMLSALQQNSVCI